jgi:osmotically inducible protein OsmC
MASKASAVWTGSLKEGKGTISTATGVLSNANYSFATRFEGADSGTTPEELIAAAHASCFSMALGAQLGGAGLTPDKIETHAAVTLAKTDARICDHKDRADHDGQRSGRDAGSL